MLESLLAATNCAKSCPFFPNLLHVAIKFSASNLPCKYTNDCVLPFDNILLLKAPKPHNKKDLIINNLSTSSFFLLLTGSVYGFSVMFVVTGVSIAVTGYHGYSTSNGFLSISVPAARLSKSLSNFATSINRFNISSVKTTSSIFCGFIIVSVPRYVSSNPDSPFFCFLYSGQGYIVPPLTVVSFTFIFPDIFLNSAALTVLVSAETETSLNTSKNISLLTVRTLNIFRILGLNPITLSASAINFLPNSSVDSVSLSFIFFSLSLNSKYGLFKL